MDRAHGRRTRVHPEVLRRVSLLIQFAILLAFAAYLTVSLVRALPPFRTWTKAGTKPWACNVCMSSWTTLTWTVGLYFAGWGFDALASAGGGGGCLCLLRVTVSLPPPALPPFEDDEQ